MAIELQHYRCGSRLVLRGMSPPLFTSTVGSDIFCKIPIIAKVCIRYQSKPDVIFKPGPFYMGKWGYLINAYAILWSASSLFPIHIAAQLIRFSNGRTCFETG